MIEIWKIAGLLVFSGLRFFLAPAATVLVGYGFVATIAITSSGGFIGFLVFYRFGNWINSRVELFFKRKSNSKFNRKTRFIVNIKSRYGIYGLAFLTPCLFGIPIGALLAASYFGKQKKTIPLFLSSILMWSIILTTISLQF